MSSLKTPPSGSPSTAPAAPPRPVPTLDELEEMVAEPDRRVVIRDVDYAFYEQLVDSIPEWFHIHVDFDGKDLEVMSPGISHEGSKSLLARLVMVVTEECDIAIYAASQTTWKRPEIARGVEADESYFFQRHKLDAVATALARRSKGVIGCPNPDLAIEVDVSPSKVDRAAIYAALQVPEVWRFDGDQLVIELLGDDERYHVAEMSRFLPVTSEEVRRWVVDEDSSNQTSWARRLRAWARSEVAPRHEARQEEE